LYKSFKIIKSDVPAFVLDDLPSEFNTEIWECFIIKEGFNSEIIDLIDQVEFVRENCDKN